MPPEKKLADVGEWGLLTQLSRFYPLKDSRLVVGFGDDTAVIDPGPQRKDYLLATVDTVVEGTHFLVGNYDPYRLGRKSVSVNLSDIAAMGGVPEFMLVSLAAPSQLSLKTVSTIYRGMLAVAREHKVILANGDTVGSKRLVITVCLLGSKPRKEHLPLRSVAQPGQYVYVTGTVGDSGAGLHILKSPASAQIAVGERPLVSRHIDPIARVKEGRLLAKTFGDLAMIDISDGLFNELHLLKKFSNVGFEIKLPQIPLSSALRKYCRKRSLDPLRFALFGGEDYELLFTTSASLEKVASLFARHHLQTPVSCLGKVTVSQKVDFLTVSGRSISPSDRTFQHF